MLPQILLLISITFLPVLPAQDKVHWLSDTEHEFGDIVLRQPVRHTFSFRNISDQPITIDNVRTSCGCTGTTWSFEPVLPDSTSTIIVEYDAKQPGYFRKYAKIFFSGQRRAETLWITGYVEE